MTEAASPLVYVNGRFVSPLEPVLTPTERGFTLADGVFETMVAANGRVFRLPDHLGRLRQGADLLELPLPSEQELTAALEETWKRSGFPQAVLRLTLARGPEAGRGLRPPPGSEPTVVVRASPLERDGELERRGVSLKSCSFPRNEMSVLTRAKFLSYTDSIVASLEARRAGADDALWRNSKGNAVCATSSNLFVLRDGGLVTPPAGEGALPGVARRTVMELALALGLEAAEEPVPLSLLADARELFLTNVARGPIAAVAVDGRSIGSGRPGPVIRKLSEAYWGEVGLSRGPAS